MTAKDVNTAYATWTLPETGFTVSYSLPLFHEIDFVANEGYRRIPHGGIEVGGLLFGSVEQDSARIEAFRLIECEHALGPSFVLSERDVAVLHQQLAKAVSDPALANLRAIGWFIAHSRGQLQIRDREAELFNELFPAPGSMTLLVKPERFQPTRFAFLLRAPDGALRDGTQHAFILPLSRQSAHSPEAEPVGSIPAPLAQSPLVSPRGIAQTQRSDYRSTDQETERPPQRAAESFPGREELALSPMAPAEEKHVAPVPQRGPAIGGLNPPSYVPPEDLMKLEPAPESLWRRKKPRPAGVEASEPPGTQPPFDEIKTVPQPEPERTPLPVQDLPPPLKLPQPSGKPMTLRVALALLVAAVLGSSFGYWTYEQLSPSAIALTIEPRPSGLLVSWPVDETRDAPFATLRVNDGKPMPLTPQQKSSGTAEVSVRSDNMKIELMVQHVMRDSRGIVRYLRAAAPSPIPESLGEPQGQSSATNPSSP